MQCQPRQHNAVVKDLFVFALSRGSPTLENRARSTVPEVLVHVFLEDPSYVDKRRRRLPVAWFMRPDVALRAPGLRPQMSARCLLQL